MNGTSAALLTDHYELTMVDAAIRAGMADRPVAFEVFTRSLPEGRRYGVLAGTGRLLDLIGRFRFEEPEIEWLLAHRIVSSEGAEWLSRYRFSGDIDAYPEGDLYTGGSPVLTAAGTFAETVLLETVILSVLNHDSAVATAASLVTAAAGGRPVIEMGSRRTDPEAAVAAARAAYIGGLASTSNLEAGRRWGVPTAGTSAHAFVMLFPQEIDAFRAQIDVLGEETTLLVDTYDTAAGIRAAVAAAGPRLGAVRIDSGDLGAETVRAREELDALGARSTRIVVTGDLDEKTIRALSGSPADGFGAGTSVVMGGGRPTSGFVYKLVSVDGRPVSKRSPGKATVGGRKWAWRAADGGTDVITSVPDGPQGSRRLCQALFRAGVAEPVWGIDTAREAHRRALEALGPDRALALERRPAID